MRSIERRRANKAPVAHNRLVHHAEIVAIDGESYRLEHGEGLLRRPIGRDFEVTVDDGLMGNRVEWVPCEGVVRGPACVLERLVTGACGSQARGAMGESW
jgi:hypothetical protein